MPVRLIEEMNCLGRKKVRSYFQTDLELDAKRLAQAKPGESYLWLLRDCGTVLAKEDWLAYQNSPDFNEVSYYHPESILAAYRIQVDEVDELDGGLGRVSKIRNYADYYEQLISKAVISEQMEVSLSLKSGETLKITRPSESYSQRLYYDLLAELRLHEDEVCRMRFTNFMN